MAKWSSNVYRSGYVIMVQVACIIHIIFADKLQKTFIAPFLIIYAKHVKVPFRAEAHIYNISYIKVMRVGLYIIILQSLIH